MTFSLRFSWRVAARKAAATAMISALCVAGSATLAASAYAAGPALHPLKPATVAPLTNVAGQNRVTENNPTPPPTVDVGPSKTATAPAPRPTATIEVQPEKAPVEQPVTVEATPEPSTPAPTISETPWPTFTPTETPQVFVPAPDRTKATSVATGAELSLSSGTSGGVGLMTWMLLLLGVTLVAGVGIGAYALVQVRGRHHG